MNKAGPRKAAYDAAYNRRPEEVKKRVLRNQARAKMVAAGKVGSTQDVDHVKPLRTGGGNALGNLRAQAPAKNRAWRKGL